MQPWWLLGVHTVVAASAVVTAFATFDIIALQWTTPTPLLGVPESIRWIPLGIASVSMVATAGCRMAACIVWATQGEKPDLLLSTASKEDDLREL
jgi:TRAP-type C4-dicarboxylate transport system permease small subunit